MPQPKSHGQKKKKKGHAPKHQNNFAFKHNPKSKKTDKILSFPNVHVCRRCYEKVEWRKQYRKYKPRTQPGKCNACPKRNVKSAYHTICEGCTRTSTKAEQVIDEYLASLPGEEREEMRPKLRACAMCVKEIALPDPEDDDEDVGDAVASLGRMTLRERRALERKLTKEEKSESRSTTSDDASEKGKGPLREDAEYPLGRIEEDDVVGNKNGEDEEDPFLKAVGGADQLLIGEAYQKKMLLQQEQNLGITLIDSTS